MAEERAAGRGEPDDDSDDGERSTFTIDDPIFRPRAAGRSLRAFPSLVRGALALSYRAGRREFLLATSLQLLAGLGVAVQLLLGREVLAELLRLDRSPGGFSQVLPEIAALFATTVVLAFASAVQAEQSRVLAELVRRKATERVLDVAERVGLAAFERPAFFDRMQRAVANGGARPVQMVNGLLAVTSSGIALAGIVAALLALQPLLVPFALLAYGPIWLATTRNSRSFYEFIYRITRVDRQRFYLLRVLTGRDEAKEIRAFNLGGHLRRRYDALYDEHIAGLRRVARSRVRRAVIGAFGSSGLTVVAMGVLSYLYLNGRLSLSTGGAALAALLQLASRLQSLVGGAGQLYEATLFIDDYNSFVDLLPDVESSTPSAPAPSSFRELVVDRLTFRYPGSRRPALRDVSLRICAGEVIALVGENGSGKTTLAKLLANLYQPTEGTIRWDGEDVGSMDPDGVRDGVAVIFQDFVRYLMPARENISAGRWQEGDDVERVIAAAVAADANRFLERLPDGYETMLGKEFEGGRDLSIGQWQRVALARAFFRDAPLVILDEPTAALDPRAEHALFERMRTLLAGRTVVLISHRFSSVRSADRIYVLAEGEVIEEGPHDDLMAANGTYAELFRLQAAAYLASPGVDGADSREQPAEHV